MKDIKIEIIQKLIKYNIVFTEDIVNNINNVIGNKKALIITDNNVNRLYGEEILKKLNSNIRINNNVYKLYFDSGEATKSLKSLEKIYSFLIDNNFNRDDYIIALGGGVIGDLSGLAASTYKRGMKFIQVPTTLLSQVDSSIGGKTAINLKGVKNIIGSFYNPDLVLINNKFLNSLTEREFLNGLVEVI